MTLSAPKSSGSYRPPVAVQIENVSKSFGSHRVLHDVSLSIPAGGIFVIMGPSGSGKSVLLKTIIGLDAPTQGRVLIGGSDAQDRSTHQRIVTSMVFQAGALFNSMSVFDNLAFYPREHALYPEPEIRDRVMHTLGMLFLEPAAYKNPSELSGGMRKRVAIARSLMMEPQLILYDEPTSELDPIMAATLIEVIATLKERLGVTSIVVSHDRDLACAIGEQVALLFEGRVHAVLPGPGLRQSSDPKVHEFLFPGIDLNKPRFKRNASF
jgi:phospholipid/cholesterol/gamma-HCH transport system ATP-binding protein